MPTKARKVLSSYIKQGPNNTFVTRLHLRYNTQTFPEDLMLPETGNRSNI
ncbi:MAG: hypothetical protein HOH02_09340 [Oceanospirillaceae bacterium]|nr:hypothetical protein [Oceanospirillaceae bacterium]MBT7329553.1 hypothetical protein [Oceanospirillaceae bacterium]